MSSIKRYAIVTHARDRKQLEAYLPENYEVIWQGDVEPYDGATWTTTGWVIAGRDAAGWTLDGYVIPRLGSGLIRAREIDLSHPVMKQVPQEAVA
jgi:hypothetical protein